MRDEDLADFIACYRSGNRHKRKPTWDADKNPNDRWRAYGYDELIAGDKSSLDIFWLRDKSLTNLDSLPEPEVLATNIVEDLEAALESFQSVLGALEGKSKTE